MTTVFAAAVLAAAGAAVGLCALTIRRWLLSKGAERHRHGVELAWALVPLALLAWVVALLTPFGNA